MAGKLTVLCTLKLFLLLLAAVSHVEAYMGDETYEKRRRLIKSPKGLKIEDRWIAHVEGTEADCKRVRKQINELKKRVSAVGILAKEDAEAVTISRLCLVEFSGKESLAEEVLREISGVVEIEQDMVVHAENAPASWGLDRIDQEALPLSNSPFETSHTGVGVTVYVLDTGINRGHNDFNGRAAYGGDLIGEDNEGDGNGHGTHCAGTVGGTKYGVAKDATIVGVKVLNKDGSGSYSGVIRGIEWAVTNATGKAGVISMSLGGPSHKATNEAVVAASEAGMIVVVAAGNDNTDACVFSPAGAGGNGKQGNVVSVGSTNILDTRSSFSNYGKCVDTFAPGSNIASAWIGSNNAERTISGTSMATPHVAGVAAVLLEKNNMVKSAAITELFDLMAENKVGDAQPNSPNLLLQVPQGSRSPTPPTVPPTQQPTITASGEVCASNEEGQLFCYAYESSTFGSPMPKNKIFAPLKIADTLLCNPVTENYTDSIVLVSRGTCYFFDKAKHASEQGALAVIFHMANDDPIFPPAYYDEGKLEIPSVMISLADADNIKELGQGTMIHFGGGSFEPTPPTSNPTDDPSSECGRLKKWPCRRSDKCKWKGRDRTCIVKPTSAPTTPEEYTPCSYGKFADAYKYCGGNLCSYEELKEGEPYEGSCATLKTVWVWTSTPCTTKSRKAGYMQYKTTRRGKRKTKCAGKRSRKRSFLCCN